MRFVKKFESFDNEMSKEEMIQKLCNFGWERQELEMMSDNELSDMCSELPAEMSESKSIREHYEKENYMFFSNIENIHSMCQAIMEMNENDVDAILSEHNWALDHIATSADDIEEVYQFLKTHKPSSQFRKSQTQSQEITEAKKQWIKETKMKKGALHKQLGYDEDENIPDGIIKKIVDSEVGTKVKIKGEEKTITALMKKRANLAKTLKKLK